MTLLKDNNYKDINVALLSLEADIKNKVVGFDTSVISKQLAEINSRIDKINAGNNNSSAEINDIRYEIENINSKLNAHSVKIESIEQKLSDIFSAENKVADFNATTNSGIYYWATDAANKPGTDYGVLLVNKYDSRDSASNLWVNQVAYGTNNKIYFRQNINSGNWTEWKAVAFEGEVNATTKVVSLSAVTTNTTKYIKLGTFHWNDSFSFKCKLRGDVFEDNVNINILSGNTSCASVCGYYSTNSRRTKSIIVKRGGTWNSDFEIYLQVSQATDLSIGVTIDKGHQDRINISESTTAPSGDLEEIAFNNQNGMFTNNIDAKNLPRIKYADYRTGELTFSSITDQKGIELSNFGPEVTEDNVLSFMVIWWSGVQIIASGDWAKSQGTGSSGLKCALHALHAGTGQCVIRCVYMV